MKIKTILKKGFFSAYTHQLSIFFYSFYVIFIFNFFDFQTEYGQYILLLSSLDLLTSFIGFNSGESVIYFMAKKKYSTKSILNYGFLTDTILGLAIIAISLILFKFISSDYLEISYTLAVVFSFKTLFVLLRNSINGFWQYNNQFTKFYGVMSIEILSKSLLIAVFCFGILKFSLASFIYIEILTSAIFTFIVFIIFFIDVKNNFNKYTHNTKPLNYLNFLKYSSKLFATATLKSGNKKIDYLILGLFVTPLEIGIYDKLKKIFLPVNVLIQPFRQIYFPKYIKKINSRLYNEANAFIINISIYLSIIVIVFLLSISFLKQTIFDLLDMKNSYEINFLFYSLNFTSIFSPIFWWVTSFSSSVNPKLSLYANLISTFCLITLSILLLNMYGIIGIGLSLIINNTIIAFYWIIKYKGYEFEKNNL